MKKLLLALVLLLAPAAAFGQCNGIFPASNVCGTTAAGPGIPGPLPLTSFALAPGGSSGNVQTNNGSGGLAGINNTQLTALINPFSSTLAGLVPASGGSSTSLFLNQAGSFTSPSFTAQPAIIPGGRLCLQMAGCVGGIPTIDVPALATKVVLISCGQTTWTVPLDFTSTNQIQVLGGSGGAGGSSGGANAGASGGGGYSSVSNVTLTPGATVTVSVPCGGVGGSTGGNAGTAINPTYVCNTLVTNCASIAGSAVIVGANPGAPGTAAGGSAAGGSTTGAVGTTKTAGGASGTGGSTGAAGGGGAAGPSGNGGTGSNGSGTSAGAGGTGDSGVAAGGTAPGGAGNPFTFTNDSVTMKVVNGLSGGAGGQSGTNSAGCASGFGAGNNIGYGGGVGGSSNGNPGQAGCPGVIIVNYTPSPSVITYTSCAWYISGCGGNTVPYYNGTATIPGTFNSGGGGLTLTLSSTNNPSGNCYEIFYYNNSSSPVIGTGPAFTSCVAGSIARAASGGLTLSSDGFVLVNATASMPINNGASSYTCPQYQCTVLGIIHTKATAQVAMQIAPNCLLNGPKSEVGLQNYQNKYMFSVKAQDCVGQYTYNSTSARALDGQTTNAIAYIDGLGTEKVKYFYAVSFAAAGSIWAGTNQIAVNQSCATGVTHGAGFGAYMMQMAGNGTANQGAGSITWDSPYAVAGLNQLNPCDGGVNAIIAIFQLDFGQYGFERWSGQCPNLQLRSAC